jgi:hypothetical protein
MFFELSLSMAGVLLTNILSLQRLIRHDDGTYISKMGKCSTHCLHPELPLEASHHRCHNYKKKIHALCSSVRHPRADALGLGLGNDILSPPVLVSWPKISGLEQPRSCWYWTE